jgi:hypothetical protein
LLAAEEHPTPPNDAMHFSYLKAESIDIHWPVKSNSSTATPLKAGSTNATFTVPCSCLADNILTLPYSDISDYKEHKNIQETAFTFILFTTKEAFTAVAERP